MLTKNGALAMLSGIAGLASLGSFIAAKDPRTCYQHDVLAWTTCTDVQSQYLSGAVVLGIFAAFGLLIAGLVRARRLRSKRNSKTSN